MSLVSYLDSPRSNQHLLLLQSSIAQSSLPVLRHVLVHKPGQKDVKKLLFCFLHPPSSLITDFASSNLEIHDLVDSIPGYDDSWSDTCPKILKIVQQASPSLPIEVIIDSVDTLLKDNDSTSQVLQFLKSLLDSISARSKPSRLILHLCAPSKILLHVVSTAFSPSITHLIAHPPVLLIHLATEYMTPPPPFSPEPKFWGVFIPISERVHDVESLIFGQGGEGSGQYNDMVLEAIVRGGTDASGRRKAVERFLEGWDTDQSRPVQLGQLRTLASIWKRKTVVTEAAPDPTQNVSFNLHLTPSQQESRARVPLPYAHEGRSKDLSDLSSQPAPGAILYDPDSADDLDDDDPDEDLDI
ncbi:hypothetical protein GYMLUDRAFT_149395 [Collybiopsis luxurians FD-317 M1]|nr:hypothetical protein GYMLUDRAFT_149395 [Collybiopsis luxurians FD-317 M1]